MSEAGVVGPAASAVVSSRVASSSTRGYLIVFAQKHEDFRLAELDSLLVLCGVAAPRECYDAAAYSPVHPFLQIDLPSRAVASRLVKRAILVKRLYELWAAVPGGDAPLSGLVDAMGAVAAESPAFTALALDATKSWALDIKSFGRKLSSKEQQTVRMRFSFLPFAGKVQLRGANNVWTVVIHTTPCTDLQVKPKTMKVEACYFCRLVGDCARDIIDVHDLKKRKYLGPTSMDAELSLVMANMGLVRPGAIVLDPYVGTGSLLVACAQFGAVCMGTDIDHRVLRGKGAGKTMRDNFEQYGLPLPEIVRMDLSPAGAAGLRIWAPRRSDGTTAEAAGTVAGEGSSVARTPPPPLIDAIVCGALPPPLIEALRVLSPPVSSVCSFLNIRAFALPFPPPPHLADPPYGIRAGARKSGSKKSVVHAVPVEFIGTHIPQTQPYAASEVMRDLLELAARCLVVGGRLVYLLPVDRATYDPALLPAHDCLRHVANSEQGLTRAFSRRLITMEKTRVYVADDIATFEAQCAAGDAAEGSFYSNVSEKIGRKAGGR